MKRSKPLRRSSLKRRPRRRQATPQEEAHKGRVASLPCILSTGWGHECIGRTTVHHKSGAGMGLKSSDFETMPLCEGHHLVSRNSVESMGSKAWERRYGPQSYWLEMTRTVLAREYPAWNSLTGETVEV